MLSQVGHTNPLEIIQLHRDFVTLDDEEVAKYLMWMNSFGPNKRKYFEHLGESLSRPIPPIEKVPILEKKPPSVHLLYAFGSSSTLSVIISFSLSAPEEEKLLRMLHDDKSAIGWSLADIKGI